MCTQRHRSATSPRSEHRTRLLRWPRSACHCLGRPAMSVGFVSRYSWPAYWFSSRTGQPPRSTLRAPAGSLARPLPSSHARRQAHVAPSSPFGVTDSTGLLTVLFVTPMERVSHEYSQGSNDRICSSDEWGCPHHVVVHHCHCRSGFGGLFARGLHDGFWVRRTHDDERKRRDHDARGRHVPRNDDSAP